MRRLKWLLCVVMLLCLCPAPCLSGEAANSTDPPPKGAGSAGGLTSVEDMKLWSKGKRLGVLTGSSFDKLYDALFPECERFYFNSFSDMAGAMKSGRLDGFMGDEPVMRLLNATTKGTWLPDVLLQHEDYAYVLKKGNTELAKKINDTIAAMKADGSIKALRDKWFSGDESRYVLPNLKLDGRNGVLRVAFDITSPPFNFLKDGAAMGYEMEIMLNVAHRYGYSLDISIMDFQAVLPAVQSGKADVGIGCVTITPERAEQVLFSDPSYNGGVALLVSDVFKPAALEEKAAAGGFKDVPDIQRWSRGKRLGVLTGSSFDKLYDALFPECQRFYFNSFSDMAGAMKNGRLDGFMGDEPVMRLLNATTKGTWLPDVLLQHEDYAYVLKKGNTELAKKINDTIAAMKADGSIKALRDKWFSGDESRYVLPNLKLDGRNGVLRVAFDITSPPFNFLKDGIAMGYEMEIMMNMAHRYGYSLDINIMDFQAVLPAVHSGKADVGIGCVTNTPQRAEQVLFSDPSYNGGVALLVSDAFRPAAGEAKEDRKEAEERVSPAAEEDFFTELKASFNRTFIREDRWKLIVEGLGVTLLISVASAIFGTVLGFGVCLMRMSKLKLLNVPAKVYIRLLQGTPMVVLLMILYYLVFGDVAPVLVAIIGFSINLAAYVSEMMRTGIEAVDRGQIEAARALGFSAVEAFRLITLPQAARHFLPVFKGEFISLVKTTSIVGYIAIQDLTKMSDIIRSRTYEAFFPLIITAAIYFFLSWGLSLFLTAVELHIDPKHRARTVKGVKMA